MIDTGAGSGNDGLHPQAGRQAGATSAGWLAAPASGPAADRLGEHPSRRGVTLIGGGDAGARQRVVEHLRQARLAWRQAREAELTIDDSLWLQTGQVAAAPGAAGQGRAASAKTVSEGSVSGGGAAPVGRPASRFATAGARNGLPWGRAGLLSHASHAAGSARGPQVGVAGAPQAEAGVLQAAAAGASQAPEASTLPAEAEASVAAGPDERFAGGCICCLGGPAFRTTLVRLLRRSDWHHLYLEVNAEPEHVLRIVEQLRSPPFSQYLAIALLVEVVGSDGPADGAAAPWASTRVTPDGDWQWLDPLAPWPFVAVESVEPVQTAQSAQSVGSVRPLRPVESVRPAEGAVPTWLALRWPADQGGLPSRDEVAEALWALAAVPGLLGARAVLQGSRSTYDWRLPAGGAASADAAQEAAASADLGLSGRNLSAVLRPRETGWRLDNRLLLEMAQGIDLAALNRALLALQELWR